MTRHLLPLLFVLSVACRSVLPDDTDATRTHDTDGDTDDVWEGFTPHSFGPSDAEFAVDGSGRAVSWSDPGGAAVPIRIAFTIADESASTDGFLLENSCTVTFEHPGPISEAGWAGPLTAFTAFALPDDATATSDCSRLDFPPEWADGPESILRRWTWGFGIGPLHADAIAALGEDYAEVADLAAGGGYYWDGLVEIADLPLDKWEDGWVDTSLVFAYETDVNGERVLVGDDPVPLEADTLPSGPGVRPAWYDIQAISLLTPARLLLTDLTP